MKTSITKTQSRISLSLEGVKKDIQTIAPKAYDFFYYQTPVKSGNARSRTKLRGDTIEASYPYAGKLDNGYSRQSPKGMSNPTKAYIKSLARKILGK